MSRRVFAYVLIGVILFPLFLAATAPASWVGWGLDRVSDGRVQLASPSGYLWGGEGTLVVSPPQQRPFALGRLGWELDFWPLLQGQVRVRLSGGDAGTHLQGEVELAPGRLTVRDALVRFPAELVTAFYPAAVLFGPGGAVAVTTASFSLRRSHLEGQATIAWDGAATRLSRVQPLGDYRLYVESQGNDATIRIETAGGPLRVDGAGQWRLDTGEAQLDGVAYATARQAELESLLRWMGRDQGAGRRAFSLIGRIGAVTPLW